MDFCEYLKNIGRIKEHEYPKIEDSSINNNQVWTIDRNTDKENSPDLFEWFEDLCVKTQRNREFISTNINVLKTVVIDGKSLYSITLSHECEVIEFLFFIE